MVDRILVEELDRRKAEYKVIHPGQPHPNSRDYPNYVFLTERPSRDEGWVQRFYCNATRSAQDTYNQSISYADESVSTPIFIRSYLERRETYVALAKLSTFSGVVSIKVTNGGSGYLNAPTIGFSGGAGGNAAAIALVYRGAVVGVVVLVEGTNYTSAPTVIFTPVNGGSGAAATAQIQPTTCKLWSEKAERLEGDIHESLFLRVWRTYVTLPGASVVGHAYNEEGVKQTITEQTVQTPSSALSALALLDVSQEIIAKDTVLSRSRTTSLDNVSTQISYRIRPGGGLVKRTEVFPVDPTTKPTAATLVIKEVVEAIKDHQSRKITEALVAADGSALTDDEGYTVSKFDPLRQVWIYTTFKWVAQGTIGPARGSVYLSGYANDSWTKEGDLTDKVILAVEWTTIPLPRSELKPLGVQLPKIVSFTSLEIPVNDGDPFPPPYYGNGIDHNTVGILRHRQLTLPAKVIYTYHYGQLASLPRADRVISFTSKFLPITDNTIHPPVQVTRSDTLGLIEDIPASIPASYDPNDIFVGGPIAQRHWKSNIWEREVWLYSENLDPTQFAQHYAGLIFVATQQNDILLQPAKGGEVLYLRSASGAEATVVTIYGRLKGVLVEKKLTLSGTTELSTSPKEFDRVRHLRAHDDPEGVITLRGSGTPGVAYAEFTSVPTAGNTLTVGKTGTPKVYTFVAPSSGTITNVAKASLLQGESVTITLGSNNDRFWMSLDGTDTSAPANPGTLTKVDLSLVSTDAGVAGVLMAAIHAHVRYLATVSTNVVTVTALPLAAISFAETVVNAGFTTAVTVAGSDILDNQVRTTTGLTGSAITLAEVDDNLEAAVNQDTITASTSGKYAATAINPDVTAAQDADNTALVRFDDKTHAPESQAWTLSQTGTSMTLTAFITGVDGPTIATLNPANATPYNRHAYRDVILSAPEIIAGEPENATPNVPATVNLTSDPMLSPVASGAFLRIAARGGPALPASYQLKRNSTVTITIASPGVVTWTAHPLVNGNQISFTTTGTLPTGLVAGTTYYVVNKAANTFELSATEGGSSINTSGTQSGVHTASGWANGAVTLPNIGGGNVYEIALTENDLEYIRVKVNNLAGEEDRAVHVELIWAVL